MASARTEANFTDSPLPLLSPGAGIEALPIQNEKGARPVTETNVSLNEGREVHPATPVPLRRATAKEVSAHNRPADVWIIIGADIYDVTKFQGDHPGGQKGVAGKDATKKFDKYHRRAILEQERFKALRVGTVQSEGATQGPPKKGLFSKWRS